ncbi:hypothetical protein [Streptomyces sp. CBMA156]|uniref:hypothetical protein n=1 Tax=Streptomyces sp. CBMA156 TaxID=1930280 RepID=UPI0016621AFA|nr:hypothetical protein [Streptomyces sp. CBMA156]MBD0669872.1 hypothetical protein [Streptomyces sp. CBMA156]MBD0672833.1 hypothetical protein [Streptomyces sp. CBMA156]
MGDASWLFAAITGVTAVGASWTTGRLSARSARHTAELDAGERRGEHTRQARRTAYMEFIACVHTMGTLHGSAMSLFRGTTHPEWHTALSGIHEELRENYHRRFLPALDIVCLEGPDDVAEAALAVVPASTTVFGLVEDILRGAGDPQDLPAGCARLWDAVRTFTGAARRALNA